MGTRREEVSYLIRFFSLFSINRFPRAKGMAKPILPPKFSYPDRIRPRSWRDIGKIVKEERKFNRFAC
jgi:hypothetical protein